MAPTRNHFWIYIRLYTRDACKVKRLSLILAIGYIFMGRLPQVWVRIWTEHGTITDRSAHIGAYITFSLATVLLSGVAVGFFMIVVTPK